MNSVTRRQWVNSLALFFPAITGVRRGPQWREYGQGHPLSRRKTFASFVAGPHNQRAFSACRRLAASAANAPSMLYLWGPPAVGKSHLLQATARVAGEARGARAVWYGTAAEFKGALIEAIHEGHSTDFRSRFRGLAMLLLDDIQLLRDMERTTEELVELLDWIMDAGGSVVISGAASPGEVTRSARLADRLGRGHVSQLGPVRIRSV